MLVNSLAIFNEVITGTERVLDTPLPTAYTISIAQITWIYILALPFQLYNTLFWVTIPSSIGN
jgi:predicted membrane chloride channel (bestrophin family)